MNADPRLPQAPEAERYLITCIVGWPERAAEIVPLVDPVCFVDERHVSLWRQFKRQLATTGVDVLAAAKRSGCADYLVELSAEITTTAHAPAKAEAVRDAGRARALYDVVHKAGEGILRGRPVDSVLCSLNMALDGFEVPVA